MFGEEIYKVVFADLFFLYGFLPVCLILYFISKNVTYRNIVLVTFSLVFYAWGEPVCVFLLIFSAFLDYINGLVIDKYRDRLGAKLALAASLIINLGLLGFFKYSGFIVENINALLNTSIPQPQVRLPIGISFYTFQTISYTIDCYWGKVKTQKNVGKYLMYLSLFPQLVAGPVVRYSVIENEIDNRKTTLEDLNAGFSRIILGLAKKVIIANNLSTIVETLCGNADVGYSVMKNQSVAGTWLGIITVALWYYFDFSGYSDIAIGLGRIFGFKFNENFNYPFICRNITEFWQRWHISVGSFFRDYLLYLPVFGKRRPYFNLFLVWFSTGLWHGASWNFIFWGLYYGIFIFIEQKIGKKRMKKIPGVISHIYSKLIIVVGFGIFHFESMGALGNYFKALVGANGAGLIDSVTKVTFMNNIWLFAAAVLFSVPVVQKVKELMSKNKGTLVAANSLGVLLNAGLLVVCSLLLVDTTNNVFLYFNF